MESEGFATFRNGDAIGEGRETGLDRFQSSITACLNAVNDVARIVRIRARRTKRYDDKACARRYVYVSSTD